MRAKIETARQLQKNIGGDIIFFYHDSDHDYRETIITLEDTQGNAEKLNFEQENKIQKKYSPLYAKRIPADWKEKMTRRLPRFVDDDYVQIFASIEADNVGDFCLEMYTKLGILDGIQVIRSSDTALRSQALDLQGHHFVDVMYENETVRAEYFENQLRLHRGGGNYIQLPDVPFEKKDINPGRDERLLWMQSLVHCTHYIYGEGEKAYMNFEQTPEIEFMQRDTIEAADHTWIPEIINR